MSARATHMALDLGGERFHALKEGLLWHPASETLIVADLHLEKGSAFAIHGQLLPPYDSIATLKLLTHTVFLRQPKRVISLGDAFHDHWGATRLPEDARVLLDRLRSMTRWTWVVGNHDPDPAAHYDDEVVEDCRIGGVVLRHELDPDDDAPEISGHYHPKASAKVRGGVVRCRCFALDGQRLILPSYGVYTGGLNILGEVIRPLMGERLTALLISGKGIYRFDEPALTGPGLTKASMVGMNRRSY